MTSTQRTKPDLYAIAWRLPMIIWQGLFFTRGDPGAAMNRGEYLVRGLGHCGECHTPRNLLGGLDRSRWLGGAAHPSGKGRIPNITSGALTWSEPEIVEYLTSGFTPDFDTAGGEMTEVIANTSRLPQSDREALAAYLKAVPAVTD
jgi:mono/diheme cytochrome c family protein